MSADRRAELEAFDGARRLLDACNAATDVNDVDALAALFDVDGVLRTPVDVCSGRPAIADYYRVRLKRRTRHLLGPVTLRLESDGAGDGAGAAVVVSRAPFVALLERHGEFAVGWGEYSDRIAVDGAGVRFLERVIEMHGGGNAADTWRTLLGVPEP